MNEIRRKENWTNTSLGAVSTIYSGIGFPKEVQGKNEGEFPVVKVSDISFSYLYKSGKIKTACNYLERNEIEKLGAKIFPPDSILFAKIGEAIRLNRRVITASEVIADNNVMGIIPKKELLIPKFLFYFLNTMDFYTFTQATTVPSIRKTDIEEINFSYPNIEEQIAIVAKIDELFSQLDTAEVALKRARANLKRYRQSVLQAAVTGELTREWRESHQGEIEPTNELLKHIQSERRSKWEADQRARGKYPKTLKYEEPESPAADGLSEIPVGWAWVNLGQISWSSNYGTSTKCDYGNPGIPILRIPNIKNGVIICDDLKFASENLKELQLHDQLENGDLLVIRTNGSKDLIGRAGLVTEKFDQPTYFASYLIRFRLINSFSIHKWVNLIFESPWVRSWINQQATTTAGQYNVNQTSLRTLRIPIPDVPEISQIIQSVDLHLSNADFLEETIERSLIKIQNSRKAILQQAFTGCLLSQEPML